eukprot:3907176-Pyramimonas_sp.AAC.1
MCVWHPTHVLQRRRPAGGKAIPALLPRPPTLTAWEAGQTPSTSGRRGGWPSGNAQNAWRALRPPCTRSCQ